MSRMIAGTVLWGEPKRGTLLHMVRQERGKINTPQKKKIKTQQLNLMIWVFFSKLNACSVSVSASSVFFYVGKLIRWLKRGLERPGETKIHVPNYLCDSLVVIWRKHNLFPFLLGPSPCRP